MSTPLSDYLAVQRTLDVQVRRALLAAMAEADELIKKLPQGFRRTQMYQARRELRRVLREMYGQVGQVTDASVRSAARSAANSERWAYGVLAARFGDAMTGLQAAVAYNAEHGIDALMARLENRIPLSAQVYRANAFSSGKIDEILNRGLVLQKSAREIARDVRDHVNPNTPGGASYAAMRLARTEIQTAFHEQQKATRSREPWTEKLHWNLSGTHPKPDDCNVYADIGDYEPDQLPSKPHPNCLCYVTTKTITQKDFVDRFLAGDFDDYMRGEVDQAAIPQRPGHAPEEIRKRHERKLARNRSAKRRRAREGGARRGNS